MAVPVGDPSFADYTDIEQLPKHLFAEIRRFFEDYKALEDKQVEVDRFLGSKEAIEAVIESFAFYRREESRLRGW